MNEKLEKEANKHVKNLIFDEFLRRAKKYKKWSKNNK